MGPQEYASRSTCKALCDDATECRFIVWGWTPSESYYRCATFTSCATHSEYQDGDSSVFVKSQETAFTLAPTPAPTSASTSATPAPTPAPSAQAPAPTECGSCQACMANNGVCYGEAKSWCDLYPQYTWCGQRRLGSSGQLRARVFAQWRHQGKLLFINVFPLVDA